MKKNEKRYYLRREENDKVEILHLFGGGWEWRNYDALYSAYTPEDLESMCLVDLDRADDLQGEFGGEISLYDNDFINE